LFVRNATKTRRIEIRGGLPVVSEVWRQEKGFAQLLKPGHRGRVGPNAPVVMVEAISRFEACVHRIEGMGQRNKTGLLEAMARPAVRHGIDLGWIGEDGVR